MQELEFVVCVWENVSSALTADVNNSSRSILYSDWNDKELRQTIHSAYSKWPSNWNINKGPLKGPCVHKLV